jgi:hypothetical protein
MLSSSSRRSKNIYCTLQFPHSKRFGFLLTTDSEFVTMNNVNVTSFFLIIFRATTHCERITNAFCVKYPTVEPLGTVPVSFRGIWAVPNHEPQ